MSDELSVDLGRGCEYIDAHLSNFMLWLDMQPLSAYAGILEEIGTSLYRHGLYNQGSEIKHVALQLRGNEK